jgi:hypothetical protein
MTDQPAAVAALTPPAAAGQGGLTRAAGWDTAATPGCRQRLAPGSAATGGFAGPPVMARPGRVPGRAAGGQDGGGPEPGTTRPDS